MPTIFIYKDQKQVEKLFGTKKTTEEHLRQKLTEHKSVESNNQENEKLTEQQPAESND